MNKCLVVVDMQNDFIDGALGTKEAVAIVPHVLNKIKNYEMDNQTVCFTQDTHIEEYLSTQEGKNLPVVHCVKGTPGWDIAETLKEHAKTIFEKNTFGSTDLATFLAENKFDSIEFIGLCTDICVVSNALLTKAFLPEVPIIVDSSCCAGVTVESHTHALETMKMCQIDVQ